MLCTTGLKARCYNNIKSSEKYGVFAQFNTVELIQPENSNENLTTNFASQFLTEKAHLKGGPDIK